MGRSPTQRAGGGPTAQDVRSSCGVDRRPGRHRLPTLPHGQTEGAVGARPRGTYDSSVSVVICAYTEERWTLLVRAVRSVAAQTRAPAALVVVVDHCPGLLARATAELAAQAGVDPWPASPRLTIVANSGRRGLADSRNTGIATVTADVVAFLDDDAAAETEWLQRLCRHYDDPHVVGVGGRVVPEWASGRPAWFPPEFDWVVGCSYRGLPVDAAPVRNPIGANMSFRRDMVVEIGGFSPGLGRIGSVPLGCEETELSLRLAASDPGCSCTNRRPRWCTTSCQPLDLGIFQNSAALGGSLEGASPCAGGHRAGSAQ